MSERKDRRRTCSTVSISRLLECSEYLAEKLTNQPVLKVDNNFEGPVPEAELARSKKEVFPTKNKARALM